MAILIVILVSFSIISILIARFTSHIKKEQYLHTEKYLREYEYLEENVRKAQSLLESIEKATAAQTQAAQQKIDSELNEYREKKTQEISQDISVLETELADLKEKRKTINENIAKEQEVSENSSFYSIELTGEEKSDIDILRTIEYKLHNRLILYKLIYETFYKNIFNELMNRVIGGDVVSGIYKITNTKTGLSYIGKSTNIKRRWIEHVKTSLNIGTIARTSIHDAIQKYGIENFTWTILEKCSKTIYSEREKFYIQFYETHINGYNLQK